MSVEETVTVTVTTPGANSAADALEGVADAAEAAGDAASSASGGADKAGDALKATAKDAAKATSALDKVKGAFARVKGAAGAVAGGVKGGLGKAFDVAKTGVKGFTVVSQAIKNTGELAKMASEGLGAIANGLIRIGETVIARDNLKATLDQVTRGRGKEAFAALEKQAQGLNISVQDATEQFVSLRKAGASNIDASKLIALRADLAAVGVSGADADAAVQKALGAIKGGKGADAAIRDVAKAFGAVGDGSNAAAKKAYTVEGAFTAIKLGAERTLGKLADKLAPQIMKLGSAIESAIDNLDPAKVDKFADGVGAAIDVIVPLVQMAGQSFGWLIDIVGAVKSAITEAGPAMSEAWAAVGSAFSEVGDTIGGAFDTVGQALSDAVDAVTDTAAAFVAAGKALVDGFIEGIEAGIADAAAAAGELGSAAEGGLKSALGIASPSKVATDAGDNFGTSFSAAQDAAMPDLTRLVPTPTAANDTQTRSGTYAPSSAPVINISVSVQSNASPEDIGAEIAIAVESALRRVG